MIERRVLLSDLGLQDDCLLVYCTVAWQTCVLMRMRAITVSSKVDFDRVASTFVVIVVVRLRSYPHGLLGP